MLFYYWTTWENAVQKCMERRERIEWGKSESRWCLWKCLFRHVPVLEIEHCTHAFQISKKKRTDWLNGFLFSNCKATHTYTRLLFAIAIHSPVRSHEVHCCHSQRCEPAFALSHASQVSEAELLLVEVQIVVLILLEAARHGECGQKRHDEEHQEGWFALHVCWSSSCLRWLRKDRWGVSKRVCRFALVSRGINTSDGGERTSEFADLWRRHNHLLRWMADDTH